MNYLLEKLNTVVKETYPEFHGPVELRPNDNLAHGDFGTAVAFAIGKQIGAAPKEVAEALVTAFNRQSEEGVAVSLAPGAPFINFLLSTSVYARNYDLAHTLTFGDATSLASDHTVNLEFISANPTGPLTLANSRGGYVGDALARVLSYAGAKVEREYYYNDSGNQIMELGRSIVAAREGHEIEGGYKGQYIEELAKIILVTDPYQAGQQASEYIFNTWIKPMIARMGIDFDTFTSEQSLIDDSTLDEVLEVLKSHELIYEQEGALWLKTTKFGDDKDRVMRRSDEGATYTYLMKDIAYHWHKLRRDYTDVTTMVGADHFAEAKTLDLIVRNILAPAAQWTGTFRQPILQFVRLIENGQEVKMSKRAGSFVTIDDLLDKVNSDVARFFFLMRDLSSHMDFDLTLAQDTSDKNPVYYIQYAYVRAKHILEQSGREQEIIGDAPLSDEERRLLIQLLQFEPMIEEIVTTYDVHKLPYYAIEVAKLFHSFYAKHSVLKAETESKALRLALTRITFHTLQTVLGLMGISQPERMVQENK